MIIKLAIDGLLRSGENNLFSLNNKYVVTISEKQGFDIAIALVDRSIDKRSDQPIAEYFGC